MTTFKYRGVEYGLEPTSQPEQANNLSQSQGQLQGQYRGQAYSVSQQAVPQPVTGLTYRGVSYRTTPEGGTEVIVSRDQARHAKPRPIQGQSPASVRQRQGGLAELHRRTLLQRLQHRMKIARAEGNRKLVAELEQELQLLH